jgi:hypothetical protein
VQSAEQGKQLQTWEIFYPDAAATGLYIARSRVDPTSVVWAHSAPESLAVTVREGDGPVLARGEGLKRVGPGYPMTRLAIVGDRVTREDRFPTAADLGELVILPGGEAGRLLSWWNAEDGSEWRWQIELYNHK